MRAEKDEYLRNLIIEYRSLFLKLAGRRGYSPLEIKDLLDQILIVGYGPHLEIVKLSLLILYPTNDEAAFN